MDNKIKALLFFTLSIFILIYPAMDNFLINIFIDYEEGIVERVIDGDTVVIDSESVRLLGINSPEKGEMYSEQATKFLKESILGRNVKLHFGKEKYDKYNRKLAYIFLENKNINLESVKMGYSNYYFPKGEDRFSRSLKTAWDECLLKGKNLCKQSNNKCIFLESFSLENQEVVLKNSCNYKMDLSNWSIKDEGRKKLILSQREISPASEMILTNEDWGVDYVWTKSGDSLFLRDEKGDLVLFYSY